jgi:tRNA U34 2-thiouridine synthase MnmA/TrmU
MQLGADYIATGHYADVVEKRWFILSFERYGLDKRSKLLFT